MKGIIDKLKIHNRIRVGYGTAFFLLLISYLLTLLTYRSVFMLSGNVDHTNNTIIRLEKILSDIKDGETGARGYAVMKDERFLEPYFNSHNNVRTGFSQLRRELVASPAQLQRLDTLNHLVDRKFLLMEKGIAYLRQNNFDIGDSIRASFYEGKVIMDSIRLMAGKLQNFEKDDLAGKKTEKQQIFRILSAIIVASLIIAFLLLLFGFLTYMRENKARRESDEKVAQYQEQLRERIMELRSLNKELLQMRSIEKFAATGRIARTIAHEVRNPLTNINLAIEQLKSEVSGDDTTILFEMVQRNSSRINQLITDLLNSTKFAELSYTQISVNSVLDESLDLAKDRIVLYNIKVKKNYGDNLCEVSVDKEKLKIAFLNIIVNAIEAMEPGTGVLTINTRSERNKCVIEIADNGTGMDKDSVGRLFEPYFTSKPKGNGLGLTNTQNIILNHKGTIQAESEKGQGTMITIILDFAA
ncbi:MAG: CHASE3 domain-containing protein [Bacteroidota bacterium]|nr:CHASE3 domain-containing protein [Bacteroidota bacterium]